MASIRLRFAAGLVLASVVIACLGFFTYSSTRTSLEVSRSVWHTHQVLEGIQQTLLDMEDATGAIRGYILTGDHFYLEHSQDALSDSVTSIENIRKLTKDNPQQSARLAELETSVLAQITLLGKAIDINHAQGLKAAEDYIRAGNSKSLMAQVRKTAGEMRAREEALLDDQEADFERRTRKTLALVAASVLALLLLLATVYYMFHKDLEERLRVRGHLQESEGQLRSVLEAAPVGVMGVDTRGRILLANEHVETIFGYGRGELIGSAVDLLLPEQMRGKHPGQRKDYAANPVTRAMGAGRLLLARRKDGSEFPVEIGLSSVQTNSGRMIIAILEDVTESKRMQTELMHTNAVLDSIVENIPAAIYLKDARTLKFVRVNRTVEQQTGFPRSEILGRTIHDIISPQDEELFLESDRQAIESGALVDIPDEPMHTRDHGLRYMHTKKVPIAGPDGRPAYLLGVSEDITEHKMMEEELLRAKDCLEQRVLERTAELHEANLDMVRQMQENRRNLEALRESQQKLALHIEQTPLAAIEWNLNYEVMEWNPAAEKVFGYTRDEALGRHAGFIVPAPVRPHTEGVLQQLVERSGGTRSTNENLTKDGRTILCEWYNTPLVDKDGKVIGVASLASDISEYRQLEDQLRQSQRMEAVGQLAGGVAHDFNNLLNVILGYCDLVIDAMPAVDPQRTRVEHIRSSGQRAAALTRQLLAFSRKQVLEPRIVNLNDILHAMSHLLPRLITENIELQTKSTAGLHLTKVDPSQMEQVILNLVINARDAMPDGGTLLLSTFNVTQDALAAQSQYPSEPGDYVELCVSDSGTGMDAATQARIFEPFFTTKEPGKGTGLGLSTVYGIVKQSGGYITVQSELGKGTTFCVFLPRTKESEQSPELPVGESIRQKEARATETILLVEDDETLQELTTEFLASRGYHVLSAGNGAQALSLAASHKGVIHLVLSDVIMPGMSGPALVEKLSAMRPGVKALFVSGYTRDAIVQDGNLSPGLEFLQKPYRLADLAQKVRGILDSSNGTVA
jgi:PAS domain S-box-containing protein